MLLSVHLRNETVDASAVIGGASGSAVDPDSSLVKELLINNGDLISGYTERNK